MTAYDVVEVITLKIIKGLLVCLLCVCLMGESLKASEYLTYQSIEFDRSGKKLLDDLNSFDLRMLNNKLGGRRFWGWRTVSNLENEKVYFQKETLYVIENGGTSAIRKRYYFSTTEQDTVQISASGSIAIDVSGDIRTFKSGLESELSASYQATKSSTIEESVEINIDVDPGVRLEVEIYGEGKISNGVAAQYRFFRKVRDGGWEIFTLTTEYYSIVKAPIE